MSVASAVLAGLVLVALEALALFRSPEAPLEGAGSVALFVSHVAGTLVAAGALVGLAQGTVLMLYPAEASPAHLLARALAWIRGEGGPPGAAPVRMLALSATFAALMSGAILCLVAVQGSGEAPPQATATWAAAVAIAALPAGWLLYGGLAGGLRACLDRRAGAGAYVPTGTRIAVGLLGLAGAALLASAWFGRGMLRALPLGGPGLLLAFAASQAGFAWWLVTRRGGASRPASRILLLGGLIAAGSGNLLLFHMDDDPAAKRSAVQGTVLTGPLLGGARALLDRDGDGYAALLGGGDCDDAASGIHPGAADVAGNGIDEDCEDGDALPVVAPVEPEPAPPVAAAGPPPISAGPAPGKRWSFLIITVDALRWDHVGAYGYGRATTPNIDRFAEGATLFERAWSQAPQTKASVPSMLTGRYFSEVKRSKDLWVRVHPSNPMFPEALRDAGYKTAGVMAHFFFKPRFGCHKGFDTWDLSVIKGGKRSLGTADLSLPATERALEILRAHEESGASEPLLLWVHYYDPHHPYVNHDGVPRFGRKAIDRYDAEIANADRQIGRLLDHLDHSSLADETVVLFHSDHGEGFGEHGYVYHGIHIYEDQLRVPLIIRVPGRPGRRVERSAGIIDMAPTILEMAGIDWDSPMGGHSLVPTLAGTDEEHPPPVFAEMVKDSRHSSRKVMIEWPWKLHYSVTYNYYELFNLEDDPGERRNLVKRRPEVLKRLRKRLKRWMVEELQEIAAGGG